MWTLSSSLAQASGNDCGVGHHAVGPLHLSQVPTGDDGLWLYPNFFYKCHRLPHLRRPYRVVWTQRVEFKGSTRAVATSGTGELQLRLLAIVHRHPLHQEGGEAGPRPPPKE
jgi:hypothetical protein